MACSNRLGKGLCLPRPARAAFASRPATTDHGGSHGIEVTGIFLIPQGPAVQITAGPISKVSVNTARQNVNIENLYVAPRLLHIRLVCGGAARLSCCGGVSKPHRSPVARVSLRSSVATREPRNSANGTPNPKRHVHPGRSGRASHDHGSTGGGGWNDRSEISGPADQTARLVIEWTGDL